MITSTAMISADGRYRYTLTRVWDEALPLVAWVMLNPSTADASKDDPTIRKCVRFAKSWGYGGIVVVNLFAARSANPDILMTSFIDPVGPSNDEHIRMMCGNGRTVIVAWGLGPKLSRDRARVQERATVVGRILLGTRCKVHALGFTKDGTPRHPLYLSESLRPIEIPCDNFWFRISGAKFAKWVQYLADDDGERELRAAQAAHGKD